MESPQHARWENEPLRRDGSGDTLGRVEFSIAFLADVEHA